MTESVSVPAPTPELGDTISHELPDVADQVRVPPPVFVMLTVCEAGVLSPKVYEKLACPAESEIVGGGAAAAVMMLTVCCPPALLTFNLTSPL